MWMRPTFEEVYRKHHDDVFNFILSRIPSYSTALDLTSEVFVKALKAYSKFQFRSSVKTWLFKIAMNVMRDYWKRENRKVSLNLSDDEEELENPIFAYEQEFDEEEEDPVCHPVSLERFKRAYHSLSPEHKRVLWMFYVERMTYSEIARSLGISVGTVKSRLNRAKRRLYALMGGKS